MGKEQELMRQRQSLVMARQDLSLMKARNTAGTTNPSVALYQMGDKALAKLENTFLTSDGLNRKGGATYLGFLPQLEPKRQLKENVSASQEWGTATRQALGANRSSEFKTMFNYREQ